MKLPDYQKCTEINQLLVAMGVSKIPLLPKVSFTHERIEKIIHTYPDPAEIKIDDDLKSIAIPARKFEFAGTAEGLLEYKGRKVCAYIRDQKAKVNFYNNTSDYRFHLCNCGTMQSMRDIGREHRFLTTQRSDGLFEVHDLTTYSVKKGVVKMQLCQNCIQILKQKGIYKSPFSLKEYFKKNNTFIPKTIKRVEEVRKTQTYSPNQKEISLKYRKANNFVCQICNVDCSNTPGILHLHHKDGNPANNERFNLQVLCVDCHSKQPRHSHMLRNSQFKNQINTITKLRIEQGILSVA
ncbi:HNH endonuclease [Desulforhopalus vacuolatus]|uniref:HNH endonuclease n=1 Tax=Desulforhopalus vacuolatus TaxID=40414 RepID=UPI0019631ED9|nr:HNH endonuclease [Desulforhopalus vacuolatus]MBM9518344.1 HNH endonuclease [Desulforhopalus vacuolatus]